MDPAERGRLVNVIAFPAPGIVAAYRVVLDPRLHSAEALALATTLLVRAVVAGDTVPPTTLDRLVWLALLGPAPLDLRRRLADRLAHVDDDRVRGRAVVQLRDPAVPADRREVARRLLGGRR